VEATILVSGGDSERARAEAARLLRRARKVILTSHENTDADGAGSALGLAAGLRLAGIEALPVFPSPLPANLRFLPGAADAPVLEAGAPVAEALRGADCVLSLDSGSAGRLGGVRALGEAAPVFLNVDHHASNEGFGTHRWVDPSYAAVGVMAFELLCEIGSPLPREVCLCLYTALVHDTGGFAYSNTDPRSHRMAAACLERGVRTEEVTAALHRSRSPASWAMVADALGTLRVSADGAVAWILLPRAVRERHGIADADVPELVEVPVSLARTRIAFLLAEGADGAVRVSLRSRCPIGVHRIAALHGGGGHARAAGMTLPATTLQAAETLVLEEAGLALQAWSTGHRGAAAPQDA
jgi:phosphoesterase RecJ-like protein